MPRNSFGRTTGVRGEVAERATGFEIRDLDSRQDFKRRLDSKQPWPLVCVRSCGWRPQETERETSS